MQLLGLIAQVYQLGPMTSGLGEFGLMQNGGD